jgi:hypothetical protein
MILNADFFYGKAFGSLCSNLCRSPLYIIMLLLVYNSTGKEVTCLSRNYVYISDNLFHYVQKNVKVFNLDVP